MNKEYIEKALKNIEYRKNTNRIKGISSGFRQIDDLTDGWQPADLVVIAEPYSDYPLTLFGVSLALNAVHQQKRVAYFSFEQSPELLVERMIKTEFPNEIYDEKGFERIKEKYAEKLEDLPIFIENASKMSIFDLRKKARHFKQEYVDMIIIDNYNHLTITNEKNKKQKGERGILLSTLLKELAQELTIPIIVLLKMEKELEFDEAIGTSSPNPEIHPKLSEFDEWTGLELNADIVALLQVYECYGTQVTDWNLERGYTRIQFYKIRDRLSSKGVGAEIYCHTSTLCFPSEIYRGII